MSSTSSASTPTQNTSLFPSPTNTSNANNPTAPQSSSLYLFTFLATLLLLLAVSCAIVIRSFILRRRFRRRLEEAIAAGVLLPTTLDDASGMGRRRRDFGEKPKLWEVWVDDHEHLHDSAHEGDSLKSSLVKGDGKWDDILPVSATIVSSNTPKPIPLSGNESAASLVGSEYLPPHVFLSRLFRQRPFMRRSRDPTPSPVHSSPQQQNGSEPQLATYPPQMNMKERLPEEDRLQVSVLISMPNPNARKYQGTDANGSMSTKGKERGPDVEDGEPEIPDVVFGITEVGFRR